MPEYEVVEFARTQLTLPDKLDPADEMSWQHYLYSKLGKKEDVVVQDTLEKADKKPGNKIEDTVERIVAMAKVLYGLHMVSTLSGPVCPLHVLFRHLKSFTSAITESDYQSIDITIQE